MQKVWRWIIVLGLIGCNNFAHAIIQHCPDGYRMDMYGVACVRAYCPEGYIVDQTMPSGCRPLLLNGACKMNCNPLVQQNAPDGRECPPCAACPKNPFQVCDYFANQCKCRDQ